ncbi:hypothetical protein LTR56_022447 [Elasticomyces elasticus]|nr:hypothetical protein LTR56_022447 [Elasticomyces elasticus]KAK3626814.1 hypothetical protein LTR22_023018 [Elasticomyces elasticus]KAK4905259.1 hypothetical protein LTR49_025409 [Elasticomyces elasticus]KAK5749088.1 hypothetical protein LTS12_020850 [Elasticomyces elasticus]
MATITLTQTDAAAGRLFLRGAQEYGDFRDNLQRDGFAVIKGAVPRERADQYAEQMWKFLEDFGLDFDRNDPSKIHKDFLPQINEKGMCFGYGLPHEKFTWDIRSEPGVVGAFEKVYDTKDLIVSFDAVNIGFPNRKDLPENKPWPHQDQNREKPGFRCLQGLVNLLPSGPNDGGLIVCKGSHLVSEEFHKAFEDEKDRIWAWTTEWYGFTDAGMKWLDDKGFVWEKVCMEPGDLVVWDSRAVHYNLTSTTDQPRFATYTCYMPAADASQEDLLRKKKAFEQCKSTTHWPNAVHVGGLPVLRDGEPDPYHYLVPKSGRPQLSERAYKLTGIPYIKEEAMLVQ